jgi:membrane protease YdiL (CAAX protease family)
MVREGSERPQYAIAAMPAAATVAIGVVLMVATSYVLPRAFRAGLRTTLVASEIMLMLPPLLAHLAVVRRPISEALALRIDRRSALLALAAGLFFWVGSLGLLELQYTVWAPDERYLEAFRQLHAALRPAGPWDAFLSVLAIGIAPAVCEEIVTRGVVLPAFARPAGVAAGIVGSAVVFGLMHVDFYRLPFTFAVGTALAVLRLRTASLSSSMIAHGTLNTLTFVAAPFLDDPEQPMPDPRPLLGAALFAVGAGFTFVLFRFLPRVWPRFIDSTRTET